MSSSESLTKVQVGMRSTLLDGSKEDRAKFGCLLRNADVFCSNRYVAPDLFTAETPLARIRA